MTAPDRLVDPGQAFLDGDPTVLHQPDPFAQQSAPTDHHSRTEFEIAAAVVGAALLMRRELQNRNAADPGKAGEVSASAWERISPLWLRMALPAIKHAYELGRVENLSPDELEVLAADYTDKLGDYLAQTSGDALAEGFDAQLAGGWNEKLAWHRAAAAWGLDRRDMRAYTAQVMSGTTTANPTPTQGLIPAAARSLVDKALMARGERIGASESWTATQSGQALAWLWLQRNGRLPAGAQREWDTAGTEHTCTICAPLNGRRAALDEPFTVDGRRLFAPQAHPGCRCRVQLVMPTVSKAYDPQEHRIPRGKPGGGEWVKYKERTAFRLPDPVADDDLEDLGAGDLSAGGSLGRIESLGAVTDLSSLSAAPQDLSAAQDLSYRGGELTARPAEPRRAVQIHRTLALVVLPGKKTPPPQMEPQYLPADEFRQVADPKGIGKPFPPGQTVNFSSVFNHFEAESGDPWAMLEGPASASYALARRGAFYMDEDEVKPQWDLLVKRAREARAIAVAQHTKIVPQLHPSALRKIVKLAGYEPEDLGESLDDIRSHIIDAVNAMGRGNDSLADAYADYVAWLEPKLTGSAGSRVAFQKFQLERMGVDMDIPELTVPTAQVFVFDQGLHPDSKRLDELTTRINGRYRGMYARYRSGLAEKRKDLPLLQFGMQELHMRPADD